MATPLVIPQTAVIKVNWTQGPRAYQNVLMARGISGHVAIDQTVTNAIQTGWQSSLTSSGILPLFSTLTSFANLTVKDIDSANKPEFAGAVVNVLGTGTGDPLPLSVAAVATLRTALAGKSFRGRVYISGWTEAQNDSGGRTAAAVNTAVVALLNAFNSALGAQGLVLAVGSRPAAAKTIPERVIAGRAGQSNPVSLVLARNTKWESQRRRTGRS